LLKSPHLPKGNVAIHGHS